MSQGGLLRSGHFQFVNPPEATVHLFDNITTIIYARAKLKTCLWRMWRWLQIAGRLKAFHEKFLQQAEDAAAQDFHFRPVFSQRVDDIPLVDLLVFKGFDKLGILKV